MTDRMYRLLELHQRLDRVLRRVQRHPRADPAEIARLRRRKLDLRLHLTRLAAQHRFAF